MYKMHKKQTDFMFILGFYIQDVSSEHFKNKI